MGQTQLTAVKGLLLPDMGRKEPCPSTQSQSKVEDSLVKTFDSHTDVTSETCGLCAQEGRLRPGTTEQQQQDPGSLGAALKGKGRDMNSGL